MIILLCVVAALMWLGLGVVGYFMVRCATFVDYGEPWDKSEKLTARAGVLAGPCFILAAIIFFGKKCFRKRTGKGK